MALTGTFAADFSQFFEACQKAEVSLRSFETGSGKVESALNRMVDNFSGRKVITDATLMAEAVERVGGVSKLTEDELARVSAKAGEAADKLRAMGQDVPAGIQKIADATKDATTKWGEFVKGFDLREAIEHPISTVTEGIHAMAGTMGPAAVAALGVAGAVTAVGVALFELTERAAAAGGKLNDMSEKTGLSVPALSRLSNAVRVAGSDLDTISNVLFNFQRGIAEDTPKFEAGLQRIGLSLQEIKKANVDEYLTLLSEHFIATTDPSERAAAAMELFNKQGRDILPTLLKLGEAMDKTNDIKPWTAEQAKSAEEFEMSIQSLKIHAEDLAMTLGREMVVPIGEFIGHFMSAKDALLTVGDYMTGGFSSAFRVVKEELGYASVAIDMMRGSLNKIPDVAGTAKRSMEDFWKSVNSGLKVPTMSIEEEKAAIADLTIELDKSMAANKARAEQEKAIFEDEQKAQGLALDLESHMHDVFLKHWKEEEEAKKRQTAVINSEVVAGFEQIRRASEELHDIEMKSKLDSTSYRINKIWEEADAQIAAFKGTGEQAQAYAEKIIAIAADQASKIEYAADEAMENLTQKGIDDMNKLLEKQQSTVTAAAQSTQSAMYTMNSSLSLNPNSANLSGDAAARGGSVAYDSYGNPYVQLPGMETPSTSRSMLPIVRARAGGGSVSAGQPYMVGEKGPELFVPSQNGGIVPNGGGNASFVFNLYGTPAELAQQVKTIVMRDVLQGRKLGAA